MKHKLTNTLRDQGLLRQAAIVCNEIAADYAPILYAERSNPEDAADSGWQFLCGRETEDWHLAKVWAVHEVLKYDPSLIPYIELTEGTVLTRKTVTDSWRIKQ